MENKIKHLEFIQNVIERMSNNSFLLKGWSIIIISALFALASKDSIKEFIYIAYFPTVVFWILDGYYLRQERLYRGLYNQVRRKEESQVDFSLDTSEIIKNPEFSLINFLFSKTILLFYSMVFFILIIVSIILMI